MRRRTLITRLDDFDSGGHFRHQCKNDVDVIYPEFFYDQNTRQAFVKHLPQGNTTEKWFSEMAIRIRNEVH